MGESLDSPQRAPIPSDPFPPPPDLWHAAPGRLGLRAAGRRGDASGADPVSRAGGWAYRVLCGWQRSDAGISHDVAVQRTSPPCHPEIFSDWHPGPATEECCWGQRLRDDPPVALALAGAGVSLARWATLPHALCSRAFARSRACGHPLWPNLLRSAVVADPDPLPGPYR